MDFNWSHPFVYHAGAKVGWYRLKTESEFDIKKEFLEAYEEILDESEFKENLLLLPEIKEEFTEEKPLSSDLQKLRLEKIKKKYCLLYTSPSPRDMRRSRMPSSA